MARDAKPGARTRSRAVARPGGSTSLANRSALIGGQSLRWRKVGRLMHSMVDDLVVLLRMALQRHLSARAGVRMRWMADEQMRLKADEQTRSVVDVAVPNLTGEET